MEYTLEVSDLSVSYPAGFGKEKTILNSLNLVIKQGEIFGLLGPNGAGKTTLIKSIVGLINTKKGSISILRDGALSARTKTKIGYMPEIANYYWYMTPAEILRMFAGLSGMAKGDIEKMVDHTIRLVGLTQQKNDLIKSFSKGMQVRLNIAQAILHDPEFLILDEPFSGLDPLARIDTRNILKALKERNKTILLSSHELSEAELICDTVCIMRGGRILKQGPLQTLLDEKAEHSLENYFIKIISS